MSDTAPGPELLRVLGRVARGLSLLFWGVPLALVCGVHTGIQLPLSLSHLDFILPVVTTAAPALGLWYLGAFQPQERVWQDAVDRALLLALVLLGFAPFLYWRAKTPQVELFRYVVTFLPLCTLLFLLALNTVLQRLAAMLPDESLRQDTRLFTGFNIWALLTIPVFITLTAFLHSRDLLPARMESLVDRHQPFQLWLFLLLIILPLSLTLSLIWKMKETLLASLCGARR